MKVDISQINSKLKSERRPKQSVSREQIEFAKLSNQVSKLTAKVNQLKTDLKEEKAVLASLLPAKPAAKKLASKAEFTELVVPKKRKDC